MKAYNVEKQWIPGPGGKIKLLILRPTTRKKPPDETPGILWLHGGGYAVGMASMVLFSRARNLVKKYGAVVIAPAYRLSGAAPYPAALEDSYAALCYLRDHAVQLGCNPKKLMVGGESAGGGLTVALCLYARDQGSVQLAFQMPLYPMLDDRDTTSSRNNHGLSWGSRRNHLAWKRYLRKVQKEVPIYAAPARAADYSGLPPAYSFVGEREPFYCETITYIEKLRKAGVSAHVDVYPSGLHAFDMLLPFRKISRQAIAAFERQYLYAAAHYTTSEDQ